MNIFKKFLQNLVRNTLKEINIKEEIDRLVREAVSQYVLDALSEVFSEDNTRKRAEYQAMGLSFNMGSHWKALLQGKIEKIFSGRIEHDVEKKFEVLMGEYIYSEPFIDSIISRIKRKQLGNE